MVCAKLRWECTLVPRTAVRTTLFSKCATKQICQNGKSAPYCGFTAFPKHAKLMKFTISAPAPKSLPELPNELSKCSEKSFCDPGSILAHFWYRASAHFRASNLKPKFTISAGAPGSPPEEPIQYWKLSEKSFCDPGRGHFGLFFGVVVKQTIHRFARLGL